MLLKRSFATLMLAGLSACATLETRPIADTSCTAFGRITYATPKAGEENKDDPGNAVDTKETVTQIQAHNARWTRLCPLR